MNLIDKIFLPSINNARSSISHKKGIELESLVRKAKIATYCSFGGGLLVLALYSSLLFSNVQLSSLDSSSHLILVAGVLCVLSPLALRIKLEFYYIPASTTMLFLFSIIPIRIYLSGGLYSSMPAFAATSILLAGIFYERTGTIITSFLWISFMMFLYFEHSAGRVPMQKTDLMFLSALSEQVAIATVAVASYAFISTHESFAEKVSSMERNQVIKSLSNTLTEEISAPLSETKQAIVELESAGELNQENLAKISKALKEIQASISGIQSLEKDLQEFQKQSNTPVS